ncbi:hypothetical protein BDN70DRAFT_902194 [Pholiota conissans]|uniref:Uncharacterized protein n=1 Tax=Pholiota conissans TaxID=109636 RepID=A0A9P5YMJ3_9AGAR|nr:hypothetical protein BDN70DRAFT_902194 [Pholiota conissans]
MYYITDNGDRGIRGEDSARIHPCHCPCRRSLNECETDEEKRKTREHEVEEGGVKAPSLTHVAQSARPPSSPPCSYIRPRLPALVRVPSSTCPLVHPPTYMCPRMDAVVRPPTQSEKEEGEEGEKTRKGERGRVDELSRRPRPPVLALSLRPSPLPSSSPRPLVLAFFAYPSNTFPSVVVRCPSIPACRRPSSAAGCRSSSGHPHPSLEGREAS